MSSPLTMSSVISSHASSDVTTTSPSASSADQYVHPELHKKMAELQKAFDEITVILTKNSSQTCEQLQTTEQIQAASMKPNKPVVASMLAKLYNAAKPLSKSYYLPDNGQKQSISPDNGFVKALEDMQKKSDDKFESLQTQLTKLTSSMQQNKATPASYPPRLQEAEPQPEKKWKLPPPSRSLPPPSHDFTHTKKVVPDFLKDEEYQKVKDLLDSEVFSAEGGRGVVQYGDHYEYMGSKSNSKVKPIPELLQNILDRLNSEHTSGNYKLNSILVNKFEGPDSHLPEHSDDEYSISPVSDIFTISLGDTRTITYKDSLSGTELQHVATPGSLYTMSRDSQSVFRHRIDKDPTFVEKVRYSITVRCIHWTNLNSTVIVGDSNTRAIKFGVGRGTVGQATPGKRVESIHIEDVNAATCASFKNVVLMVGTNNLKSNSIKTDRDIQDLVERYRDKIHQIRKLNQKCHIHVVPVIPCKADDINVKIGRFNNLVVNELVQHFSRLFIVEGTHHFADFSNGRLAAKYLNYPDTSGLHLNKVGIASLVRFIKNSIFQARHIGSRVHNRRTFANTLGPGTFVPGNR